MDEKKYLHAEVEDEVLHIEVRNLAPEIMAVIACNLIESIKARSKTGDLTAQIQGALNGIDTTKT